jgi:cholesterol transport system auxiliary component
MTVSTRAMGSQLSRRRLLSAGAALLVPAAVQACQLPGSGPPPREYRLTPKTTFDDLPKVKWSLVVTQPQANPAIATARIARIAAGGLQVQYYADAIWVDQAPAMVQPLIVQSFRSSGAIAVVADDRTDLRPDFVLSTDLTAFQAQQKASGPTEVSVSIAAKLFQMPRRDVVGTTEISRSVTAETESIDGIVAAFDDALGKVLKRVVEWTLMTGHSAPKSR